MSEANVTKPAAAEPAARNDKHYLVPAVDVVEDAGGITLYADLPGVTKEGLNLHVDGDTLTIEGNIALALAEGAVATHVEVNAQNYRRAFTLSRELDADKVQASFEAGVLQLRVPKAEHAQPRKVEIQVG
ncbi:Hsp20/alpha crystallin family protein [Kerstersia gyiorum]|jgi:HSP20 family molecular chaperone IbpA|uniref:Hsp20/alpha crystallin family protein n=1 Tax=Kerstersia gyiorum TaxID=206506 RepID=UPI00242E6875|nr:Hsp20/alpha crystallin family protein [Kerstersia gyiorum]MCH4271600.1 Hsp20/alpha crystallin family protein [Kerstersia gyiorum]MCI1228964.1 Hsp20/alpha crystallin family protein [Kerstersia gyiorum]